jgi:hypothetical protein
MLSPYRSSREEEHEDAHHDEDCEAQGRRRVGQWVVGQAVEPGGLLHVKTERPAEKRLSVFA